MLVLLYLLHQFTRKVSAWNVLLGQVIKRTIWEDMEHLLYLVGPCPGCIKESGKRVGHSGRHNGPCPDCVENSGRITGHGGSHATFAIPEGWTKEVNNKNGNFYINPEGDKRFKGLPAVERFVNGEKAFINDYKPFNPNVERYMNAGLALPTPPVHKKGECLKCHNEPSYFVLDFVDVPAGNGIMSCITATRDRPGISTIVKFVDRVMRPSL